MCGQPIATVLVSSKEKCRGCNRKLNINDKLHPVVIYSLNRGTHLCCRMVKMCHKCKIYEHYGYWSVNGGEKHFEKKSLDMEFLLSSEDTAFEMDLVRECSNLLIVGAVPFSTYATSYNRRFGYQKLTASTEGHHKIKRMRR